MANPRALLAAPARTLPRRRLIADAVIASLLLTTLLLLQQLSLGRAPFGEPGEWSDVWVAMVHVWLAMYLPLAYLAILANGRHTECELCLDRAAPKEAAWCDAAIAAERARIRRGGETKSPHWPT